MYRYKGNTYEILNDKARMKHPITREWQDAVIYIDIMSNQVFVRKRNEFYNLFKNNGQIPYHILMMSKLYNILPPTDGNKATGEIRKFEFQEKYIGTTAPGARATSTEVIYNEDYDALWRHIGNDYFKMIGCWPKQIC